MHRHRPDGTLEHPYSALRLRMVLAGFGIVFSALFAYQAFNIGLTAFGWFLTAIALIATVNLVVVARRWHTRS